MRALLWIIAIFAVAAGVAMLAGSNEGYVLLVLPPWRAQASLNLVVVALLLAFVGSYFALRLVAKTLGLPGRVSAYRSRRRQEKASRALNEAVRALFEGRFSDAMKRARVAYSAGGKSPQAALIAARAAHEISDQKHYLLWMERAGASREGRVATLLTEAEFALDAGANSEASRSLEGLRAHGYLCNAALRMALDVAEAQGKWDQVPDLVSQLFDNKALTSEQARSFLARAHIARLRQRVGDPEQLAEFWRGLSREDMADRAFVEQALPVLASVGKGAIARRSVERLLESEWSSSLAREYVLCAGEGEEAKDALSRAERWLTRHPEDAGLLYSLGRQCMSAQIWGKAQSYLETSAKLMPSADVYFALAELMEALERPTDAKAHYRRAASLAMCPDLVPTGSTLLAPATLPAPAALIAA